MDGKVLCLMAHFGPIRTTTVALPIAAEPLNQHVLASGETVYVHDIAAETDPMFAPTRARVSSVGVRTLVYTPLLIRETGSERSASDVLNSSRSRTAKFDFSKSSPIRP